MLHNVPAAQPRHKWHKATQHQPAKTPTAHKTPTLADQLTMIRLTTQGHARPGVDKHHTMVTTSALVAQTGRRPSIDSNKQCPKSRQTGNMRVDHACNGCCNSTIHNLLSGCIKCKEGQVVLHCQTQCCIDQCQTQQTTSCCCTTCAAEQIHLK